MAISCDLVARGRPLRGVTRELKQLRRRLQKTIGVMIKTIGPFIREKIRRVLAKGWVALPSNFYFGWLKKESNSTGNQNQIDNLRVAFQPG